MNQQTIEVSGSKPVCISFTAQVNPITGSVVMGALTNSVNSGHDEIHFMISTPGGTVADGVAIYNMIRALPVPVRTYNMGSVNSIGNVLFQAGLRRISATASSFMFHGVGFDIQNARLELKELKERMENLKSDQSVISDIMVRHTNLGVEEVNRLFLEMAYISAEEALERGITDEVRDIRLPQGMPIQQLVFQG